MQCSKLHPIRGSSGARHAVLIVVLGVAGLDVIGSGACAQAHREGCTGEFFLDAGAANLLLGESFWARRCQPPSLVRLNISHL
jgi:hypothetical protein